MCMVFPFARNRLRAACHTTRNISQVVYARHVRAHRLVTLVFSHYNEKARWALQACGIAFEERAFVPGFSQLGVGVVTHGPGGRADKVSTRWSTPVLLTASGETLCDSTEIALWASRQIGPNNGPLFPDPGVIDVVEELGRDLGPYTRLIAYKHVLPSDAAVRSLADNVGAVQSLAYRALAPLGKQLIQRG